MRVCLGTAALLCSLAIAPAYADSSDLSVVEQKPISYNRANRFSRPVDPVIYYRSAENAVVQKVKFSELPGFIKSDIEKNLSTCKHSNSALSAVKAVSYVSDHIRARGLSPNYLVDFSDIAENSKPECLAHLACNTDGCLAVAYHSIGFEEWKRDIALRNLGWDVKKVEDERANTVPNPEKNMEISVFDFSMRCADQKDENAEACHIYRVWSAGGLQNYEPKD